MLNIYRIEQPGDPVVGTALFRAAGRAIAKGGRPIIRRARPLIPRTKATWNKDIAAFHQRYPSAVAETELYGNKYTQQQIKSMEREARRRPSRVSSESGKRYFKSLNPKLKALAIGAPLAYAAVNFAPIPDSLAEAIAERTDENELDPFNVKETVGESQNLWEIRQAITLRDEMRERGITSDIVGDKFDVDVRTLPSFLGESGLYDPSTRDISVSPLLTIPTGIGKLIERLGYNKAVSLSQGGVLAHEFGHAWQDIGTKTDLGGHNVAPPVRYYRSDIENTAYNESVADTFEQLTRHPNRRVLTPAQLSDWGPLNRLNYGATGANADPWMAEWNKAQADVIANITTTGQLQQSREYASRNY